MNAARLPNPDATVKALNRLLAADKRRILVARVGSAAHAAYGRYRIVALRDRNKVITANLDLADFARRCCHAEKAPRPLVSAYAWANAANDPARLAHLKELDRRALSARGTTA